jgi:glycosyltransferase involved in cell wall biosynthesis
MKIALLVSGIIHHRKESLAITTINFAKELQLQGHKVKIITRKKKSTPEYEEVGGVKIHRMKAFGKSFLYNKLFCFPLGVKKHGPFDIIHNFSSSPLLVLKALLSKWFYCRKAIVIHSLKSYPVIKDMRDKNLRRYVYSKLGNFTFKLLNFANMVTVSTKVYADKLLNKGVKKNKIKRINSHIDLEKFKPLNKKEIKKRYAYDQKIVFYYGGMWAIKGIDYLINAIPSITVNNPGVKFLFAPRNKEAIEQYSKVMQGKGITNFEFIMEGEIVDHVNLADVVVMPYPHLEGTEANPSCILESLACGTPVVTTNLPELKEVFEDSVIFAEPRDSESLAEQINFVLNNDVSPMIEKGLKKVQEFDVKKVTKEFLEIYNQFLNK